MNKPDKKEVVGSGNLNIFAGSKAVRSVAFFFDTNKLIIAVNAFQKKTQKTPVSEITKAMKIKKEYFNGKKS